MFENENTMLQVSPHSSLQVYAQKNSPSGTIKLLAQKNFLIEH